MVYYMLVAIVASMRPDAGGAGCMGNYMYMYIVVYTKDLWDSIDHGCLHVTPMIPLMEVLCLENHNIYLSVRAHMGRYCTCYTDLSSGKLMYHTCTCTCMGLISVTVH